MYNNIAKYYNRSNGAKFIRAYMMAIPNGLLAWVVPSAARISSPPAWPGTNMHMGGGHAWYVFFRTVYSQGPTPADTLIPCCVYMHL